MPNQGERKTINGVTGEWNGTTWRRVQEDAPSLSQAVQGKDATHAGFGNSDVDRMLAEAKGTLGRNQKFAAPIEAAGNRAAMETVNTDPKKAAVDQFFENFGRGTTAMASPTAFARGVSNAAIGAALTPLKGLASIPEGLEAAWDVLHHPVDTVRGLPQAARDMARDASGTIMDTENRWATHPEEGGEAVTEALGAAAMPDIAHTAWTKGPALAREAAATTGRGLEALGNSAALRATGRYGPAAVLFNPSPAGAAISAGAITVPPALRGLGRVLQKLGPDAAEAATATGIPAGAAVPAELFLKDLAKLTPAQKLAELSARQSARAKGALEPLGDVAERARLGREVPYRMGEPTGVNGLNEAGPLSKMTSMAPGETAPGSIALNDASKISDIPAFEKAMADIPTTDNGLAGIKQALKKPFSHEDFTKQLRDSLDTAKATSDTFAGSDIDLSNESQLSPLDAASRLARLSRIQRASGAAYAE